MASPQPPRKHTNPYIDRTRKHSTFFSKLVFALSRAADVPLQYQVLAHGLGASLINALGSDTILPYPPAATHQGPLTNFLGLSPYRTILLSMSVGAAAKHVAWVTRVSQEEMSPTQSLAVGAFNATANTINTLLFTAAATSPMRVPAVEWDLTSPRLLAGTALFITGIALEWISEEQRKEFKDDPRNRGQVYSGGLFGWARHINYGGYMLWRAGFALAAAGWKWGFFNGALSFLAFTFSSIPELDEYCANRPMGGLQAQSSL
ncbi:hypothetical protein V5O48_018306 [Marasmius crinis-equi]|uniref:Steroid 5-alpha reductase C-terminal domain-containing protein n=1 Tax=Marasmius crinis-equi TaxID=585013 RepID=A0ABR3ELJ7_9AGAR